MSWELTGNSATNPNEHFLGTTDAQAFLIRVNRNRALRIDPQTTPNLIGGHEDNEVSQDVAGATIGGGGRDNFANRITASFGTIGGGLGNIVSGDRATVAGGTGNRAGALGAAIGGGGNNEASQNYAAIAGGLENRATGIGATVPGGERNSARGDYAFAAGRNAQADHAGSFVWADALGGDFASTGEQQFLIRASGGVGIGTNQPQAQLDVNGNLRVATEIIEGGAPLRTKYQPAGDYLTRSGGAITGNLQVSGVITEQNVALADKYQAKGNYQPAGSYITTGGGTITGHLNVGSLTVAQPSLSVGGLINLSRTTADGGYLETKLANGKAAIISRRVGPMGKSTLPCPVACGSTRLMTKQSPPLAPTTKITDG
jgi:hypothetical protein